MKQRARRTAESTEEQLRKNEELFRLITDNVEDLIAIIDPDGKRLYNSLSYKKVFGGQKFLTGADSFAEIHPDDRERIREIFLRTVKTGIGQRTEYRFLLSDGTVRFIESQGSVIRDATGAVSSVLVVSRDVTDRKHAEEERAILQEQLRQAQKLESIGTLAGGIAHDFNNILAIILGYVSLLGRGKLDAEELSKLVETINKTIERGAGLVRQLMTFARKSDILMVPVNVNVIMEDLAKVVRETFPKTIVVDLMSEAVLPPVTGDGGQIHQALLNLCVNARDAMPGGGTLFLSTAVVPGAVLQKRFAEAREDRYVCISVGDSGTGMDEITRQRIFEPFFTTKEAGKGTGLGLAVVYAIVKSHRGFIDLESTPGKGSTFHLYFPVSLQRVAPSEAPHEHAEEGPGGDETLLVVEDEPAQRDLVTMLLEGKGYKVLSASDGVEAVATYERYLDKIALVISDIGLPKQTGLDAFLRMRTINPKAKVIFATGYLDQHLKDEIIKQGLRDFLQKPYVPNEILTKIRDAINRA